MFRSYQIILKELLCIDVKLHKAAYYCNENRKMNEHVAFGCKATVSGQ